MSVITEDIGLLLREKENVMRSMKEIAKQGHVLKKIPDSAARNQVAADLSKKHKAHRKALAELEARVVKTEGKIPRGTALMVASDQDTRSFDFYGVDALGYKLHRREAIEVGTRAMFRLTNFRFAVGTHMARDILYLVPAASTAFLDFLEEAHQIAKGGVWNPSYFEGHNVLLAFRLYALVTRNPRETHSRAHLDVEGLLAAINDRRFCNVKFAMEISLLIPLFFALKRFPTILTMGAWECFFECLDTADDAKRLEEIAAGAGPSKTSILVQERAVSERFEPFIDRKAVCGWSIKNSRDTAAALNAGREMEAGQTTLRADRGQPTSLTVNPAKKHRTENPVSGREKENTRGAYTVKVGDEEITIPQFGARFHAVREKGLCRFCGNPGHGGEGSRSATSCSHYQTSPHYNPQQPFEYAYLVTLGKRAPQPESAKK
jgi:hypothetical protein